MVLFSRFSMYVALFAILIVQQPVFAQSESNTYALVVGISEYQNPVIPALRFAHRDAQVFANFLQSEAGGSVPSSNITLLLNERATFTAIYDAMYQLLEIAQKNDRVFLYFSGHGDVENRTVVNLGYLLSYNTPPNNYINHAVRLEDVNFFANTLSSKNVKVILITDACRSGKLAGDGIGGRRLVGEQLQKVQNNEVRLASCGPDELSAEHEAWGGGRGVFSYYLVLGLQGLADHSGRRGVNISELKDYLKTSFSSDNLLLRQKHSQNPVVEGSSSFVLSEPSKSDIQSAVQQHQEELALPPGLQQFFAMKSVPLQPIEFVVKQVREFGIENLIMISELENLPIDEFPFRLLQALGSRLFRQDEKEILTNLSESLKQRPNDLRRFNERMAGVIQDRGHDKIAAYLKSDRAELEKRSYYNVKQGEFDKFIGMYSYAMKLIPENHFTYRSLQVDKEYFQGVLWRMRTFTQASSAQFLDFAYQSLQNANRIEPYAPYIHNELANVYLQMEMLDSAMYHYQFATELAPTWAVPWANLVGVYNQQHQLDNARFAANKARQLQPELFSLLMNEGYTEELTKNYLRAEELFLDGIKQNDLHFFPYESLGRVYAATMRFAEADKHFYEAEKRKFGFFIPPKVIVANNFVDAFEMEDEPDITLPCPIPTLPPDETDALLLCMKGFTYAVAKKDSLAGVYYGRAAQVGFFSFLANHHYGTWLYKKGKLIEAEAFLKKARLQFLQSEDFKIFVKLAKSRQNLPIPPDCYGKYLNMLYYDWREDDYMVADIYHKIGYTDEAESVYENLIERDTSIEFIWPFHLLAEMMMEAGRYEAAEKIWIRYQATIEDFLRSGRTMGSTYGAALTIGKGSFELDNFYYDMINRFPKSAYWHHKAGSHWFEKIMSNQQGYIYKDLVQENDNRGQPAEQVFGWPKSLDGIEPLPGINRKMQFPWPLEFLYKKTVDALKIAANLAVEDEYYVDDCLMLAKLFRAKDEHEDAAQWFARATEARPEIASIRRNWVGSLLDAKLPSDAYRQFNILRDNGQLLVADYLKYAEMAMLAGNYTSSEGTLQKSKHLIPEYPHLVQALFARLYFIQRDLENVPSFFQNEVSGLTKAERHYALASVYAANAHTSEAMEWLKKALQNGFQFGFLLRNDPVWKEIRQTQDWMDLVSRYSEQYLKYEKIVLPVDN